MPLENAQIVAPVAGLRRGWYFSPPRTARSARRTQAPPPSTPPGPPSPTSATRTSPRPPPRSPAVLVPGIPSHSKAEHSPPAASRAQLPLDLPPLQHPAAGTSPQTRILQQPRHLLCTLIDAELLAFINLQTNTLDVHRLVGGKKLLRVRQLCLPIPRAGVHPLSASFRLSQACLTTSSSRSRSRCLPFRPSPDACLVGLTAQMATQNGTMTSYWLAMRRDYLSSDPSSGCGPTSWETWSTRMACCVEMERPLIAPIPAGARWLVYSQPLVVRQFGLSRADRRAHPSEDARGVGVREALQDVLASQLPCCDIISVGESKYQSISADYEWVVGMNEEYNNVVYVTDELLV
ncbi:hypothetical protein H4582DRAFT_2103935 [Lactarius indigo]|nr:hypothetical protein H4582DRAFT_2103935 [Lactarius indigo]